MEPHHAPILAMIPPPAQYAVTFLAGIGLKHLSERGALARQSVATGLGGSAMGRHEPGGDSLRGSAPWRSLAKTTPNIVTGCGDGSDPRSSIRVLDRLPPIMVPVKLRVQDIDF